MKDVNMEDAFDVAGSIACTIGIRIYMARAMRAFIFGHHACHAMHKLCILLMITLPGMKIESVRREVHEARVREACVRKA